MRTVLAVLLALVFAVRPVGAADLRPHPPVRARAGQLAHLPRHLRRETILRAGRDQPRERAAAAPGVDVPGSGTASFRDHAPGVRRRDVPDDPPSDVVALDVKTGRPLWTYRRSLPEDLRACCGNVNRGVAALGDQIFIATIDAHLVALDMRTGRVRWDVEVADYKTGHSLTAAPLAVKDKVIVGMAGAEYGVRGFLDAYDAASGKRAWRLWTVPGRASRAMRHGAATAGSMAARPRG